MPMKHFRLNHVVRFAFLMSWFYLIAPGQILAATCDFDGDGKSDPTVYRPSTGTWYVFTSTGTCPVPYSNTGFGGCSLQWGLPGDRPQLGDFNADGRVDTAVLRPNTFNWYIKYTLINANTLVQWGLPGDIESVGDANADGLADLIVYRPANRTYYVRLYNLATGTITTPTYLNTAIGATYTVFDGTGASAHYYSSIPGDAPGVHLKYTFPGVCPAATLDGSLFNRFQA